MRQEDWRGTLMPGMAADLIALDRNPVRRRLPPLKETQGVTHHGVRRSSSMTPCRSFRNGARALLRHRINHAVLSFSIMTDAALAPYGMVLFTIFHRPVDHDGLDACGQPRARRVRHDRRLSGVLCVGDLRWAFLAVAIPTAVVGTIMISIPFEILLLPPYLPKIQSIASGAAHHRHHLFHYRVCQFLSSARRRNRYLCTATLSGPLDIGFRMVHDPSHGFW